MNWPEDFINRRICGDCLEVMSVMPERCVHAIVTDPPYGLKFMGKEWDRGVPGIPFWLEALRVAIPGAYLLAFGGTRTFHRLMCAIEDAGWEIRDTIMWVYGSGFPKSHDVSKAIDKRGGESVGWFGPWFRKWREENSITQKQVATLFPSKTGRLTGCVANWELGFNMPTPEQFNLIRDTFGLAFNSIKEAERKVVGYDKPRSRETWFTNKDTWNITAPATEAAHHWQGWGTALKPAWEPIIVARKPLEGTVAENVLKYGTGAMNIDGCRVEYENTPNPATNPKYRVEAGYKTNHGDKIFEGHFKRGGKDRLTSGRWPANLIHDGSEEVVRGFPVNDHRRPSEICNSRVSIWGKAGHAIKQRHNDSGSVARFFYCAKASKAERGKDNKHPTVKPLKLMEYLVKLISRDDQLILDMFAGSGSTLVACKKLGRQFVGIEIEAEYCEIGKHKFSQEVLQAHGVA